MKPVVVLMVLVALAGFATGGLVGTITGLLGLNLNDTLTTLFNQFTVQFGKSYATLQLRQQAMINFQASYDRLPSLRNMSPDAVFGITQFADMSLNEFLASSCGARVPTDANATVDVDASASRRRRQATPAFFDWTVPPNQRVGPVKNQGQCGSCWTFNSAGAVEAAYSILKNVSPPNFAEQNLLDCVTSCYGCNGGWMVDAFNYIKTKNGFDKETFYPYTAAQGSCAYSVAGNGLIGAKFTGYTQAPSKNEATLKTMIATNGPAACVIDATNLGAYKSGLYSACTTKYTINHAILIVGYGTDPILGDYWKVRNSWGASWGESGNFRMPRNRNSVCGIADWCYFPKLVNV